jgi:hypothetical protein
LRPSAFDIVAFAGFALLIWGVARISLSAALIVAGALLFYFGFVMSAKKT